MASLFETKVIYNENDIYYDTEIMEQQYLGFMVDRSIGFSDDDEYVRVEARHQYRLDNLSYDLYGTASLGWVIVRLNMDTIKDPIRDVKEGLILRVPKLDRILQKFSLTN